MNRTYKKDLYRYYGENGESLKQRMFRPNEIKYIVAFRKAKDSQCVMAKLYYRMKVHLLSRKTNIQIPTSTQIGEGFYIGHRGSLIINPKTVIGKNCNIAAGVTIGQENRGKRKGVPTIGNNCWIGANAVIVGNITIGDDVLIAPLTFVNFDVPSHSVVVGNPGKIIPRENATENYVCNTI